MSPDELSAALADAVRRLDEGDARDEAVAEWVVPRTLGIPRAPRLVVLGRAWRLGALLLMRDGTLRATGTTIRAAEPAHSALRSRIAEDRLALQVAARRGGIPVGAVVNVDTGPVPDAATSPLVVRGGEVLVHWSSSAPPRPLGPYLDEQVDLLVHPPQGAGEAPRTS